MVKLNVLSLLEKRQKTKYWLYKQLGMSYQNFNRMVNNETGSIRYDNIEALCSIFECEPNDLFLFCDDEPETTQKNKAPVRSKKGTRSA